MKVRVDLTTPIKDGMELVFKAPCDYTEVTGLTVYYPVNGITESKEFAFADAHANDLADLEVLFAKDAVVKVILDLSANKAFVQNADTNAYLEGRFADLEDKIGTGGGGGVSEDGVINIINDQMAHITESVIAALPVYNGEVV